MNDIHTRARQLAIARGIPLEAAYRELGKRGAAERKRRDDARRMGAYGSLRDAARRLPYVDD